MLLNRNVIDRFETIIATEEQDSTPYQSHSEQRTRIHEYPFSPHHRAAEIGEAGRL